MRRTFSILGFELDRSDVAAGLVAGFAVIIGIALWLHPNFDLPDLTAMIGGRARMRLDPRYDGPAVYNALLTPTIGGHRSQLLGRERSSAQFYIGPPNASSAVPAANAAVSSEITGQTGFVPLTVTMTCTVCDELKVQSQLIVYSSDTRRSSVADFSFMPMPAQGGGGRRGELMFDVTSKGAQYDRVFVPVTVGIVEDGDAAAGAPIVATAMDQTAEWPDLRILFSDSGRFLDNITLQPLHPALQAALNAPGSSGPQLHPFTSQADLSTIEASIAHYLERAGTIIKRNATSPEGALSPKDREGLLSEFGALGGTVYGELFSGAALTEAIRKVETASIGRPLRIQIEGTPTYIPWALLKGPGQADFWGWGYELVILPKLSHAQWPSKSPTTHAPTDLNLLAVYKLSDEKDSIGWRASKHGMHLRSLMHTPNQPTIVDSAGDFQRLLTTRADDLTLLFTYKQGTNGETIPRSSTREVPELLFESGGAVTSIDVLALPTRSVPPRPRDGYFSNAPIVVLTACYSGVGPLTYTGATFGESFPAALLKLGARGVVGVDAPVNAAFAHTFGDTLAGLILNSKPLPEALYRARQAHKDDPSGLLYSYYGLPTAVLGP